MGRDARAEADRPADRGADATPVVDAPPGPDRRPRRGRRLVRTATGAVALALVAGVLLWPHRLASPTRPRDLGALTALGLPAAAVDARPVAAAEGLPGSAAGRLDEARVARALRPVLGGRNAAALGRRVLVAVDGLDGTRVLRGGPASITPASTTKLLTSLVALDVLPATTRFRTRTVLSGADAPTLTLVGGGDPYLASVPRPGVWPPRADVTTLARRTARVLERRGVERVRLAYDASLFSGPAVNPAWPRSYTGQPGGADVVSRTSALWVDEGRVAPGLAARVEDPARAAADAFARALTAAGVEVGGVPRAGRAPVDAEEEVAEVAGAPVGQQVQQLLLVSDNEATEVLLRQIALAAGSPGTTVDGVRAVRAGLQRLGVPAPTRLYDGSGLSRRDRLGGDTLLGVLSVAARAPADSPLRTLLAGLPVSGLTGSLATRFAEVPADGRGVVRAKTGTLTGVRALAGVGADASGTPFLVALSADRIPDARSLDARELLERALGALARCRCTAGSRPAPR
ncbi:D-alanyl-D-alanine carboxypeptidase/D-alanyl-D-alanine-endopeptidase [Nocardioides sp. TRM66260-LWL]|uniref:D-alanyl-D-alanine carboxypeptidase/D-alanyl-D-alanine endopeptidase n=1 Tax=Nocardioides sp. TRM66260-LWL TaxID=2874478 RepID=UPI001CC826F6|nr:D-alanyl-D-alanine carboxypeptidase/D-alanyl-D-alanine-endopeptidase [Nocardioides sp. TRM66260-LWL]MBZ5734841.1 D-alanyl-D-alanine carboxypeptidase/D-alanyl-D-alanine-endopeptidase [Nocardioides sp. TRM66260-LWL]